MAHTYLWKPQNCFANESEDMYVCNLFAARTRTLTTLLLSTNGRLMQNCMLTVSDMYS
jgi:hypothetical protein